MTDRPHLRDDEHKHIIPKLLAEIKNKGDDSYCVPLYAFKTGGAAQVDSSADSNTSDEQDAERFSQKRLEQILSTLSDRDKKILSALRHCRYLLTSQVQRLYFTDLVSTLAGLRTSRRILSKLMKLGLTGTLSRRIGGVRAGSGSLIWFLTPVGERLLRLGDEGPHARKRYLEPSLHFLAHTLAVAECYVQLTEICNSRNPKLIHAEMETDCWRSYSRKGIQVSLRPDLYAITNNDDYEDRWFLEVDLKTESPITVVEKCRRYHEYYQSGLEQKLHGVFPLTVWIVPDVARRDSIMSHIRAEFAGLPKIFAVITPEELAPLVHQGVGGGVLC